MCIVIVINYGWLSIRVKSNLFWGLQSWKSMWHILSFTILQTTKGLFLVWHLGGFFIVFQLGLIEFGFSLLVLNFCLAKSVAGTLIHLILTLSILDSLCKNKLPNIRTISETKKRLVQNPPVSFFTFWKINVYGLECFRCVCHDLLSRISLTLL